MIKQKPLQLLTRALCGGSLTWAQAEKAKPGTGGAIAVLLRWRQGRLTRLNSQRWLVSPSLNHHNYGQRN